MYRVLKSGDALVIQKLLAAFKIPSTIFGFDQVSHMVYFVGVIFIFTFGKS
jgi:hypothetical protein